MINKESRFPSFAFGENRLRSTALRSSLREHWESHELRQSNGVNDHE